MIGGLGVVEIVEDLDAIGLDRSEFGFALLDEVLDNGFVLRVSELNE